MPTIEDQLALEDRMISYGVDRFKSMTRAAEDQNRGCDTTYARTLTKALIAPLADAIREYRDDTQAGRGAKYRALIRGIDADKVAYFTLKSVFNHVMKEETLQTLALNIGWFIEDELKFSVFQEEHSEYYNTILDDFNRWSK